MTKDRMLLSLIFRFIILLLLFSCSGEQVLESGKQDYIEISGGRIYYQTFGVSSNIPIILLHGGPGLDQSYLLPQMLELASKNELITYDQRGSGKSQVTELDKETINMNQFVQDLEDLRKHLGCQKFILMGHSWGGILAIHYAITYPEHLHSLVILNSAPATSQGFKAFAEEYSKRTTPLKEKLDAIQNSSEFQKRDPGAIEKFFRTIFSVYVYNPDDVNKLTLKFTRESAMSGLKVSDIFMRSFFAQGYDLRPELHKLNIPTLIVHGDNDIIPVWTAMEIRDAIPGAKLEILEDTGHFPYIERPNEFFVIIKDFLK